MRKSKPIPLIIKESDPYVIKVVKEYLNMGIVDQTQLADALHVEQPTISRYLNDKLPLTLKTYKALADAIGIDAGIDKPFSVGNSKFYSPHLPLINVIQLKDFVGGKLPKEETDFINLPIPKNRKFSKNVFWCVVPDNALAPIITQGTFVLIEPVENFVIDKIALIEVKNSYYLRIIAASGIDKVFIANNIDTKAYETFLEKEVKVIGIITVSSSYKEF